MLELHLSSHVRVLTSGPLGTGLPKGRFAASRYTSCSTAVICQMSVIERIQPIWHDPLAELSSLETINRPPGMFQDSEEA